MKEFVSHPWIKPGIIESRNYQEAIVKSALQKSTLCVVPTGLGKTSIAALVAAERLRRDFDAVNSGKKRSGTLGDFTGKKEYSKVLFLAPTKPLVNQHKAFFEKALKIGEELVTVTGEMNAKKRRSVYESSDIVFATPQTIRNDLSHGLLSMKNFCLLVVDEAHRAIGSYAYVQIAKKYAEQAHSPMILALTASPGSSRSRLKEVCSNLFIENVEIRQREDSDVKPYVQQLHQQWVELPLPHEFGEIQKLLEECRKERLKKLASWGMGISDKASKKQLLYLQQSLSRRRSGLSFAAMSIIAEVIKIDYALLLLGTQSLQSLSSYLGRLPDDGTKASSRLVKNEKFTEASQKAELLLKNGKENPKLARLQELVQKELAGERRIIIFVQYRDMADLLHKTLKSITNSRPVVFIGQQKKHGKGMSQKEQLDIIRRFREGEFNILLATSIGEEGLDIEETDTVIFYEPVPSEIRSIQRAGRTARTRPGKVIIMMVKGTADEAYYWSAYHKVRRMKRMLEGMQTRLR